MGDETTTNLPPGFRFLPSDEELVVHFLYRKAAHLPCHPDIIPTLHLPHCDPCHLIGNALQGDGQWYFFSRRSSAQINRVSRNGYWKFVGTDERVTSGNRDVGMKNTLVYCIGEAPEGIETNWIMHEYRLIPDGFSTSSSSSGRRSSRKRGNSTAIEIDKWIVCRVYEASWGSQVTGFQDNGTELSCLDEVFWSLDDFDEISLPN